MGLNKNKHYLAYPELTLFLEEKEDFNIQVRRETGGVYPNQLELQSDSLTILFYMDDKVFEEIRQYLRSIDENLSP